jgi:hypothetical protein
MQGLTGYLWLKTENTASGFVDKKSRRVAELRIYILRVRFRIFSILVVGTTLTFWCFRCHALVVET